MLKADTWLQRSTHQIPTERLPTRRLGCVLHMHPLWWEREATGYCLRDLLHLPCQGFANWPMGMKDCDEGWQLLGA